MNFKTHKMKQQNIYTTSQVEKILDDEFKKFEAQYRSVMNGSDYQTLAQYIMQVKEEINKLQLNEARA
jgi:hypothetical protein